MEDRVGAAGVTVTLAVPLMPLMVAEIVVVPPATPVTRPALTVAAAVEELLQMAVVVTLPVDPSDQVPVATNCCVAPGAMLAVKGARAMLARAGGAVEPFPEPVEPEPDCEFEPQPQMAAIATNVATRESEERRGGREQTGTTGVLRRPMPGFVVNETHHGVSFEKGVRRKCAKDAGLWCDPNRCWCGPT
jgi:hypothetical protein